VENKLHSDFNVVLDEGYPCSDQEMSPWKGRALSAEKDAFNYYLSLQRQCIERAFGILVQRWGIFWRPLRVGFISRGLVIRVACKLHNICIDQHSLTCPETMTNGIGRVYGFGSTCDHQDGDELEPIKTDGTGMSKGYRSDLEKCPRRLDLTTSLGHQAVKSHRDRLTRQVSLQRLKRPRHSKYSRSVAFLNRKRL